MQASVSQVLSKTFEMVKGRFGPLLGLFATYFAILIALILVVVLLTGGAMMGAVAMGTSGDGSGAGAMGVGVILMLILFYLVYLLVVCAQNASMTAMASPLKQLSFGDAISLGMRSALPLLGVMVLLLIGYFGFAMVFGLIVGIMGNVGSVLAIVVMLPAIVYLACRLCLVAPVVAVEGVTNPITAITRAWALSANNVLTIFLSLLVLVAIAIAGGLLVFVPMMGAFASADMSGTPPSMGGMGLTFLLYIAFIVVISIVSAALIATLHSEIAGSDGQQTGEVFA